MPISRAELLDAFSRLQAALLLSLFVAFVSGAHEARAQDQVLVSNIGQANPTTTFLGLQGASPVVSSWGVYDHAQGFTTGTNKGGYKLHSAEIQFGRIGTGLTYTVRIQNPLANGKPGSVVGTLTTPTFSSSNDDQIVTFTAPQGGIDLEASKEYLLVLAVSGTRDEQITGWNYTESDAEDSGGLSGWQIANTHQFRSEMAISILNITAGWQDNLLDGALQFRLKGDVAPSFAIADAEATEGDPITFTVNRNGASGAAVSVQWTTSTTGGTYTAASSDFTAQTTAQTLSFAAGDTSKTIEIQTTEDSIDEADETFGVILSAPSTGTSISDGTAIGTITDDDTRGVTVSASALTLDEIDDGSTQGTTENEGTYTIKLNTEPTADVTITPTVPNGAPFTISPTASLTFTPLNWETAQTITVTAINDDLDNPDDQREATITHTLVAADGSDYSGVSVSDVMITVTDDDTRGVTVSASALTLDEIDDGSTRGTTENEGTYTIKLNTEPTADVTITPTVPNGAPFTISPTASLTFTPLNWETAQTITVTAINDDLDNPDDQREATITHTLVAADGSDYSGVSVSDVMITVTDDDTRGVTVSASALTLDEIDDGSTRGTTENEGTYTIKLNTEPTADVTITPTVPNGAPFTISPTASLTFTPLNWETAQTITVTAINDDLDNPDDQREATITHTLVAADGSDYSGVSVSDVMITVTDDDVAPSFAIADAEATEGDPITFTVNRNGASGAAVSVQWTTSTTGGTYTAASSDFTAQTTAQTLSFAAGDTSKTIEIQTTEDSIDEADETFGVILSAPSTGTSISDGTAIGTITDDDTRGVTVSASALTLDEIDDGSTQGTTENEGTYTIKLNTEPTADVTITPTVPNGAPFTISPTASLTFTPLNWETAQTITVTAINDDLDNPDDQREATITHTLVAADGSDYSGVSVSDVMITVTDDDVAPSFAIADAEATEGDPITFTVNRNGASGAAVSVQWTTSTTGGTYTAASSDFTAQTTAQTLSFAAGDTSKTIEIQTTEDSIDEADETFGVILSAPSTGTSISDGTAIGTITDDDTRGVTVSASALTLDEIDDGSTQGTTENEGTYTIKLNTEPTADVTITPTVPNGAPFTISPTASLTFTPLNWETAQTITVTAINDDLDNPDDQREATITHTLVAADGSDYSGVSVSDVMITVTDDDIPVVSFVSASSQVAENGGMHYIMVTIEPVSSGNFMINLLEEGDATNGEDYKLKPDVMIAAGKSSVRLQVEIMEDDIVEEDETLKITLQSPNNNQEIKWGQKTHEVKIVDHTRLANSRNLSEWQVRFGRAVTEQVLDGITKRIEAPRHAPTQIQIAGYPLDLNGTDNTSVQDSALTFNNNTNLGDPTNNSFVSQNDPTEQNIMSLREALLESNFTVIGQNPSTQENHAFWGQISQSFFEGREGELSLEGETTTAMLGTDVTKGKWLIGMAILQSVGKGSYTQLDKPKNAIDATLTALVPYASLTASERFSIWGTLGFGSGWITRSPDPKQIQKADIEWSMAAIGFRNNLMMGVETGGLNLAVVGDSFYTATKSEKTEDLVGTSGKVTRVRLGLEGTRKITLKDNKSLTPRFTVSLRQDGGDAETGWGMEVSVGMSWQDTESGLEADFSAKNLVAHTSNGFSNWGYSLSVTYDPNPYTKRGFSASYNQSLSGSNNDIFNTLPQAGQFGQEEIGAISRQTEVSYGFPAFDGSYTNIPFVAVKESGYTRDLTLGGRLTREHGSPQLDVSYRAKRIEGSGHVPNYAVGLDLKTHW